MARGQLHRVWREEDARLEQQRQAQRRAEEDARTGAAARQAALSHSPSSPTASTAAARGGAGGKDFVSRNVALARERGALTKDDKARLAALMAEPVPGVGTLDVFSSSSESEAEREAAAEGEAAAEAGAETASVASSHRRKSRARRRKVPPPLLPSSPSERAALEARVRALTLAAPGEGFLPAAEEQDRLESIDELLQVRAARVS